MAKQFPQSELEAEMIFKIIKMVTQQTLWIIVSDGIKKKIEQFGFHAGQTHCIGSPRCVCTVDMASTYTSQPLSFQHSPANLWKKFTLTPGGVLSSLWPQLVSVHLTPPITTQETCEQTFSVRQGSSPESFPWKECQICFQVKHNFCQAKR